MKPNIFQIAALGIAAIAGGVIVFEFLKPGESEISPSRYEGARNSDVPAVSRPRHFTNDSVSVAPSVPARSNEKTPAQAPEKAPVIPMAPASQASASELPPQKVRRVKPPIEDLMARTALSYVGVDPEAEAYWENAINNPNLSADERKDLIEDLNEDGLSDPKNPGPEDMPLIASRLMLIEELAPYAMDQVNADAFAEAYKDLTGLLNGEPPQ
jgi:hypothetical protein